MYIQITPELAQLFGPSWFTGAPIPDSDLSFINWNETECESGTNIKSVLNWFECLIGSFNLVMYYKLNQIVLKPSNQWCESRRGESDLSLELSLDQKQYRFQNIHSRVIII